jgi:hypothetical protein
MTSDKKAMIMGLTIVYLLWLSSHHDTTFFFWLGISLATGLLYPEEIRDMLRNIR